MNAVFSKLAKVKAQGFVRTLEIQFNQIVPPWVFRYSKGDIYDLDAEKLKALGEGSDSDLEVKCFTRNSSERERLKLREFTWNSVPLETTENDLGYVIVDRNEPENYLGGVWAAVGSFSEHNLGIEFKFADHQAWLYCAFVSPQARGRGVYKKLISTVAGDLQVRGFTQLLGIVQPWNKISRAMHAKQSRGIFGRMSAVRVGSWVWVSHSGDITVDKRLVTKPNVEPAHVAVAQSAV